MDGEASKQVVLDYLAAQGRGDGEAIGALWEAGASVAWRAYHGGERYIKLPLPTYSFEPDVHWTNDDASRRNAKDGGRTGSEDRSRIIDRTSRRTGRRSWTWCANFRNVDIASTRWICTRRRARRWSAARFCLKTACTSARTDNDS